MRRLALDIMGAAAAGLLLAQAAFWLQVWL